MRREADNEEKCGKKGQGEVWSVAFGRVSLMKQKNGTLSACRRLRAGELWRRWCLLLGRSWRYVIPFFALLLVRLSQHTQFFCVQGKEKGGNVKTRKGSGEGNKFWCPCFY